MLPTIIYTLYVVIDVFLLPKMNIVYNRESDLLD